MKHKTLGDVIRQQDDMYKPPKCANCNGKGEVVVRIRTKQVLITCPVCHDTTTKGDRHA